MDTATIVSIVSAAIAASSAAIAFSNYSREELNQKIQTAKWKREYFAEVVKWSDESILLLSEALHLCDLDRRSARRESSSTTAMCCG
jgi:hypothetical protein